MLLNYLAGRRIELYSRSNVFIVKMRANNNTLFAAIAAFENHPAGKPPPGVVPNFEHPEDKSRIFIAVGSVLFSLMWLSVMNRFYVRWFINKKLVWGDGELIILHAIIGTFGYTTNLIFSFADNCSSEFPYHRGFRLLSKNT